MNPISTIISNFSNEMSPYLKLYLYAYWLSYRQKGENHLKRWMSITEIVGVTGLSRKNAARLIKGMVDRQFITVLDRFRNTEWGWHVFMDVKDLAGMEDPFAAFTFKQLQELAICGNLWNRVNAEVLSREELEKAEVLMVEELAQDVHSYREKYFNKNKRCSTAQTLTASSPTGITLIPRKGKKIEEKTCNSSLREDFTHENTEEKLGENSEKATEEISENSAKFTALDLEQDKNRQISNSVVVMTPAERVAAAIRASRVRSEAAPQVAVSDKKRMDAGAIARMAKDADEVVAILRDRPINSTLCHEWWNKRWVAMGKARLEACPVALGVWKRMITKLGNNNVNNPLVWIDWVFVAWPDIQAKFYRLKDADPTYTTLSSNTFFADTWSMFMDRNNPKVQSTSGVTKMNGRPIAKADECAKTPVKHKFKML